MVVGFLLASSLSCWVGCDHRAALPALPLELTILYNSLLFTMGASDSAIEGEAEGICQGLLKVLEACGACGQDLSTEELWQKVLQDLTVEELKAPLCRLGALQGAWWLAASRLGSITGLFRVLSNAEDLGRARCSSGENELLSLQVPGMNCSLRVPAKGASVPLVQCIEDLKEILCIAAAFLQGLQELEAGHLATTLSLLQEAVGGFCSKRVLAQIYTCLGCCTWRIVKPQTALQHLKRALQVDFQCLPALSHMAAVYHELGETDMELQALALLYKVCSWGKNLPAAASSNPYFLIQTDLLSWFNPNGGSALPRILEVFLEAVSALEQARRHQDAITMCEEVISRMTDLIPWMLRVEERLEQLDYPSAGAGLADGLPSQKKERL
ncbi:Fanconi anemia group G protein-like [Balearica regulorum gibbericeps]|uniref:Fanconi anemia group G protein-like n=1 Tax=Balearica regulorum gibbericeps TaxID=100784 RepID=UPI003F63E75A